VERLDEEGDGGDGTFALSGLPELWDGDEDEGEEGVEEDVVDWKRR